MNPKWSRGPVIPPRAIEAFRNRTLENYNWIKRYNASALQHELDLAKVALHTKPWIQQLACTLLGITLPQFLFLLDMGAGKTKIVLDILWWRRGSRTKYPILVLVHSSTNIPGWLDQIKEHRPELKALSLEGSREERLSLIKEGQADAYVLNYDGLQSYMTHLDKNRGRVIDHKEAESFARGFEAVVFDESHHIGNKASLRFRMCNVLSRCIGIRYALTGTPFGKNPERLWAQFYIVDHGETLGKTLGMFRATFFTSNKNYWGGMNWEFNTRYTELLHHTLNNRSISYEDKEFTDMPKCVRKIHRLAFANEAEDYYNKVRDELKAAHKGRDLREIENSFLRMRQVCAGFLTLKSEDDNEKLRVAFYSNPKLQELESIVDALPEDEKVLVFHEFVLTGDSICAMLERKKVRYARVGGKGKNERPAQAIRRFLDDPRVRYLIANNHSGATTGINPQYVCRRVVFFDCPVDPIVRKQAERRVLRPGQKRHVYLHDLVIANSVDEQVQHFVQKGEDLFQSIIRGRVKLA